MSLPADFPRQCPRGHRWGPGRVVGTWYACVDCGRNGGHMAETCSPPELLPSTCDWQYWQLPHAGQPAWTQRSAPPPPGEG